MINFIVVHKLAGGEPVGFLRGYPKRWTREQIRLAVREEREDWTRLLRITIPAL